MNPDPDRRSEPKGMQAVQEAVTFAATELALLSKRPELDERDRRRCDFIRKKLENAERILYGIDDDHP